MNFGQGRLSQNDSLLCVRRVVLAALQARLRSLLPSVVLIFSTAFSQIVVTIPEFAAENDSIVIKFDATQTGAAELVNYTGTVYAHSGVTTNKGSWQHVIAPWQTNLPKAALTRLSANLYQLTIGYPREYYSVTDPAEHITALDFVFRSSDGSKQTRPDIFVTLFTPGLSVVVDQPSISTQFGDPLRSPVFASTSDSVSVKISAAELGTKVSTLTLYVNDVQAQQSDSNRLQYDFIAARHSVGVNKLKAIGVDTSGSADTAEFVIMVNPTIVDAALPQGVEYGINYVDTATVTLALFAPYKQFVYVVGDFNNWKAGTEFFMKRHQIDANNVVWWITITGLTPGLEYAFQYLVGGTLRIGDPYTHKVLHPWNDQSISSATYPDRKLYPTGKTDEPVSVLQTNQSPYPWHVSNFQRPAKTDLIIYELLLRDFLAAHDYKTLIDTLHYYKTLGVNALELMPVMEFEGNESWGYNTSFHLALDKYYGPESEFNRLVDSAHAKGIAVILDVALNHAFGQCPLVRLYWDAANNRPAANSPWFNPIARHPFNVGYDFNHESPATQYYVDRVTKYWITEHKVDGFRFDLSKGLTQTNSGNDVNYWGQYDQSRINLLERMADKIWNVDSSAYVILEHFAVNSEETVLSNYGMMLWGNLNYNYNEATMGWMSNSDFSGGSYKVRGWKDPNLVTYMESHDEDRLMYKNLQYGNSSGTYNIKNLSTALERVKLAAAFFLTIPGPKMIWQFGELGYDYSIDYGGRTSNKPITWDYYANTARRNLFKVFSALTRLKQYDAFRSTNFAISASGFSKRITIYHPSMDATIIGNFDVVAESSNPNFSKTGRWYDYFSGDSIDVSDTQALRSLQAGEFHIYTTGKLPTPEPGIVTDTGESSAPLPAEFTLEQNYPNPFNPMTTIRYSLPVKSDVSLQVYDVLGREVATLVSQSQARGIYRVQWTGRDEHGTAASTGMYVVRLQAGGFVASKKILLMK